MFNAESIKARIKAEPFVPLRLITSSGQAYDITHPDLVLIGKQRLVVGAGSNDNPGPGYFDTTSIVSILHVTDIQELLTPAKSGSNGAV